MGRGTCSSRPAVAGALGHHPSPPCRSRPSFSDSGSSSPYPRRAPYNNPSELLKAKSSKLLIDAAVSEVLSKSTRTSEKPELLSPSRCIFLDHKGPIEPFLRSAPATGEGNGAPEDKSTSPSASDFLAHRLLPQALHDEELALAKRVPSGSGRHR